ncbi:MAG: FeoA family protein [Nostocaceae cyanobacterium]|nr:FeoA family protein [Nostocaceae cyanobacterium]
MQPRNSSQTYSGVSVKQTWQKFSFFCDALQTSTKQQPLIEDNTNADLFSLSCVKVGDRVSVVAFRTLECIESLVKMGLRPGVEIKVLSNTDSGSVIVKLAGKCVGLGADTADNVMVTRAGN